jgi:aminocarboxymuconate-semialdehyde decarboxylase
MMKVIDVQRHWTPGSYYEEHLGKAGFPRAERTSKGYRFMPADGVELDIPDSDCDLEFHVRQLDVAGISAGVVSPALIATDALARSAAKEMCRMLNQEMARAQEETAGRIVGLATVPLRWPDIARDLVREAIVDLGLPGVWLPTNIRKQGLGEIAIPEVFAELDRLGAICFLHPTTGQFDFPRWALEPALGFMFGTTLAVCELVMNGSLTKYPSIKFVHPHGGGTIPYLAGRLDTYAAGTRSSPAGDPANRPSEALRRLHTDTASLQGRTLELALEFYGTSRVMFGSDYPYFAPEPQLESVSAAVVGEERAAVLAANASQFFGIDQ